MTEPTLFDAPAEPTDPNRIELPDGSVCVIEPLSDSSSLISREKNGVCVWGQAFSRGYDHEGQVAAVVEGMRRDPAAYVRLGFDATNGPHAPACSCGECP